MCKPMLHWPPWRLLDEETDEVVLKQCPKCPANFRLRTMLAKEIADLRARETFRLGSESTENVVRHGISECITKDVPTATFGVVPDRECTL